ncbi:MAG: fibronectin type III domain-containing protein, partial [Myxococcota bacterium]
ENLVVRGAASLQLGPTEGIELSGAFTVPANEVAAVAPWNGSGGGSLALRAASASIDGALSAIGMGYRRQVYYQPGEGPGGGTSDDDTGTRGGGGGGAHGGAGGKGSLGLDGGATYGSSTAPFDFGSAGGESFYQDTAGNGGGGIFMDIRGALAVNGLLATGGQSGNLWSGGGAGGSIFVTAGSFSGAGIIDASGGAGGNTAGQEGGGGGGGRIAIYTKLSTFNGIVSSSGGAALNPGAQGTIVFPLGDSLITLVTPPKDAQSDGQLSWSGPTLPTGGVYTVYVDDDAHLGEGEPSANHREIGDPMVTNSTTSTALTVSGLMPGRQYFWQVVAQDPNGAILAGSTLSRFVACVPGSCVAADGGWVYEVPDGGAAAPQFRSTPGAFAECGKPYEYSESGRPTLTGVDPFSFTAQGPEGFAVVADTGEVLWTPSSEQEGVHRLTLTASGPGGSDSQSWSVVVVCKTQRDLRTGCDCQSSGSLPFVAAILLALGFAVAGKKRRR